MATALINRRNMFFAAGLAGSGVLFSSVLTKLFLFSFDNETYSHLALIPVVVVLCLVRVRKTMPSNIHYSIRAGLPLIVAGMAVLAVWWRWTADVQTHLSAGTAGWVCTVWGVALCCYGWSAVRSALFPALLLLFMVPLPVAWEAAAVEVFRWGSAEVVSVLFRLGGVEHLREGGVFHLRTMSFWVAQECSGIRSGLALLLVSLIAAWLAVRTNRMRAVVVALVLPVSWLKNGLRIAVLTVLGSTVNPSFMDGPLHTQGGKPFFLVGLALIGAAILLVRRFERRTQ